MWMIHFVIEFIPFALHLHSSKYHTNYMDKDNTLINAYNLEVLKVC